jgi:hypothetical protein
METPILFDEVMFKSMFKLEKTNAGESDKIDTLIKKTHTENVNKDIMCLLTTKKLIVILKV